MILSLLRQPAFGAALGSFVAFFAAQGATWFHAERDTDAAIMLAELSEARKLWPTEPPPTSGEAASVVERLQHNLESFRTREARSFVRDGMVHYDGLRSTLLAKEEAARLRQEEADLAAAVAREEASLKAQQEAAAAQIAAKQAQQDLNNYIRTIERLDPFGFQKF